MFDHTTSQLFVEQRLKGGAADGEGTAYLGNGQGLAYMEFQILYDMLKQDILTGILFVGIFEAFCGNRIQLEMLCRSQPF